MNDIDSGSRGLYSHEEGTATMLKFLTIMALALTPSGCQSGAGGQAVSADGMTDGAEAASETSGRPAAFHQAHGQTENGGGKRRLCHARAAERGESIMKKNALFALSVCAAVFFAACGGGAPAADDTGANGVSFITAEQAARKIRIQQEIDASRILDGLKGGARNLGKTAREVMGGLDSGERPLVAGGGIHQRPPGGKLHFSGVRRGFQLRRLHKKGLQLAAVQAH